MKRKSFITYFFLALIIAIAVILVLVFSIKNNNDEVKIVKSEKELVKLIKKENNWTIPKLLLTLPYSLSYETYYNVEQSIQTSPSTTKLTGEIYADSTSNTTSKESEYSTTNIQVENVDEADIVKTDGEYIYSITDEEVIITKVLEDGNVEIISKITNIGTPEDILLNDNKIIVISDNYNSPINKTQIDVFDIADRALPKKIKQINTSFDYYTSRMIDNNIYIFSTGKLEIQEDNKIKSIYSCDNKDMDLPYNKISYIKENISSKMTSVLSFDLNNLNDIEFNGMMMDLDNAYISENNIYIVEEKYEGKSGNSSPQIRDMFGYKGIFGLFDNENENNSYGNYTTIYKFGINGKDINYLAKVKEKGATLNQFSMDEYEGNLRITLNDSNVENKLCVFDGNLKKIGEINGIAPGEKIYSTRFINERAYMVTYKTIDPLFVIDLSDPTTPKILGELKIPGYSTYLHPYDENHIIGIGNDTKTTVTRNSQGKVTSERTTITGMKMALFDVTDVNNPKELYSTKIGDSRTYSSILDNHKALLFSKEKGLLAIPINNYSSNINVTVNSDDVTSNNVTSSMKSKKTQSGYLVYNINLENGFEQKGMITHDTKNTYSYYYSNQDVRGIYINDILYTISNKYIKANKIDDLQEISTLKLQ